MKYTWKGPQIREIERHVEQKRDKHRKINLKDKDKLTIITGAQSAITTPMLFFAEMKKKNGISQ